MSMAKLHFFEDYPEDIVQLKVLVPPSPVGLHHWQIDICLLYTSDAADEEDSVDLGGRRIIKKTFDYSKSYCLNISIC